MSAQDLEQRARELLAGIVEQVCDPQHAANIAKNIRENGVLAGVPSHVVIPAIAAALRQQPAPVDLEQFRDAVEALRDQFEAEAKSISKGNGSAWSLMQARDWRGQADRLLSIIDSSGKVASAGPVAWITPESIRHLAKMNGPANVVVWNCASGNARVPLYTAPHQPAPVVDDAMRELIEAADYAARYILNFSALAYSPIACKEAADRLTAAIARAQGVQS